MTQKKTENPISNSKIQYKKISKKINYFHLEFKEVFNYK
jgi:hypothetical protein